MSIGVLDKDGNPQTIMTAQDVITALQAIFGSAALAKGAGAVDATTPRTVIASDQSALPTVDGGSGLATVWGVSGAPVSSADITAGVLVTDLPASGQKILIDDILFSVGNTAMNITLKEETSGAVLFGPWYCPANSGPIQVTLRGKKKLAVANKRVQAFSSAAGNVTIQLGYRSEA